MTREEGACKLVTASLRMQQAAKFVIARSEATWQSREGSCDFAGNFPTMQPGTARLHPKGTSSRFALRAPRRFAPRNDTSGWCRGAPAPLRGLMLLHKAVTDRHAGWQCCGIDSLARGSLNCHCEEAAGRRGNLGKAVTFSPMAFLLSAIVLRDPHVASLLGMTHQGGAVVHQCPYTV